jgi:hypothetical protein
MIQQFRPPAGRRCGGGCVNVFGNVPARLRSMPHSFPTCGHLRKWWGGRPRPRPTPWSASSRCQAYESAAGAGRGRPAQAGEAGRGACPTSLPQESHPWENYAALRLRSQLCKPCEINATVTEPRPLEWFPPQIPKTFKHPAGNPKVSPDQVPLTANGHSPSGA